MPAAINPDSDGFPSQSASLVSPERDRRGIVNASRCLSLPTGSEADATMAANAPCRGITRLESRRCAPCSPAVNRARGGGAMDVRPLPSSAGIF